MHPLSSNKYTMEGHRASAKYRASNLTSGS